MTTNDGRFGFGRDATGAPPSTVPHEPKTKDQLVSVLRSLAVGPPPSGAARPYFVKIAAGEYDFTGDGEFVVRTKRLTFQSERGARVVLKNLTLRLDVSSIGNVLIQGLVFQSDGSAADGIRLQPADLVRLVPPAAEPGKAILRVSFCSFSGYRDIAIDLRSSTSLPQVLATIDHCLFFDSTPGQPETPLDKDGKRPFVNRGAINFGSLEGPMEGGPQLPSNARVTIAENAFFKVWRRTPRIATGNFGHIFNNVIYRWGFGNDEDSENNGTNTWRCIEIGGGSGVTEGDSGSALIEANRFIPWKEKKELADTITINRGTIVDIGVTKSTGQPTLINQRNRFDDPDANEKSVNFPVPPQGFSFIGANVYTDLGLEKPPVTPAASADWLGIVANAGGGVVPDTPEGIARQRLLNAISPNKLADGDDA